MPDHDMPAGRDLDAMIAGLLGWTSIVHNAYTPAGRDVCGTNPEGKDGWDGFGRMSVPRYSTRIDDAWPVFERLEIYGSDVVIEKSDKGYRVGVISTVGELFDTLSAGGDVPYSETAPLAICRAALRASVHA